MASANGIKAGKAYVELGVSDKATEALRKAEKRLEAFAGKINEIGSSVTTAGAAMTAFGGAILAAAGAGIAAFTKIAGDFSDLAAQTGLTVELMSELETALKDAGSSVEEFAKSVVKLRRIISEAASGAQSAAETLERLGLSAADLIGLSADEQFLRIADAISRVKNPTDRLALAMELFGKSAYKMMPILAAGGAGIDEFRKKAREMGFSLSGETADAADALGTQIEILKDQFGRIAVAIGEVLLPPAQAFVGVMQALVGRVIQFARDNEGLVLGVTAAGAAILAAGTAVVMLGGTLIAAGAIITATTKVIGLLAGAAALVSGAYAAAGAVIASVGAAWTATAAVASLAWTAGAAAASSAMAGGAGIAAAAWAGVAAAASAAWGAITIPIGVAIAGIAALGIAIAWATGLLSQAASSFVAVWDAAVGLAGDIRDAWTGVTDAIAAGDLALAGEVAIAGLKAAFLRGLASIVQDAVIPFVAKVGELLSNIPGLGDLGEQAAFLRGIAPLVDFGAKGAEKELDALADKAAKARREAERTKREVAPISPSSPSSPSAPALPELVAPAIVDALPDLAPAAAEIQARMTAMGGFNATSLGGMFGGADDMVAQQRRSNEFLSRILEQGKKNRATLVWS